MKKSAVFLLIITMLVWAASFITNQTNESKDTENTAHYSSELYAKNKVYSVAPSELSNKDLERPKDNTDWTRQLNIQYPQLYNMEDDNKQNKINELIYKYVMSYNDVLTNRDYNEYIINYKIKRSDSKIFSVLFIGEVSDCKTATRFAFGITINIEDGEELALEKYIKVDDNFMNDYLFTKFNVLDNSFENVKENVPYVESFVETYSTNSHLNDFYIDKKKIGIIIPTHNNMGYILIEGR